MFSVGQIISSYRKKMKLSQPELAERLTADGFPISYKAVSSWEKNTSEPSVTVFLHLCRILSIPDVYEEYFGTNPGNPLSRLNDSGKAKVAEYIELLIHFGGFENIPARIVPFQKRQLRLYRLMVSAGTGNFLDGEDFDLLEVGDEVPDNADFGVMISGDSMVPKYVNHQIVWVHRQDTLANGEIGIFCYDGNSFCKRLQKDENGVFLISLNEKYSPIPISADTELTVFGKVVG